MKKPGLLIRDVEVFIESRMSQNVMPCSRSGQCPVSSCEREFAEGLQYENQFAHEDSVACILS
jgi:hypothetical protein